jgi:DMSO/TMAO reductase YedYZ molybdopterin-dependent catalytic subunit
MNRRKLITTGLSAAAGATGLAAAARLAARYNLIPPDHGGVYGVGETLTYAAQRVLTSRNAPAREFRRDQISRDPVPNGSAPRNAIFQRLEAREFADWRLAVDGMVARPASFSIQDLRSFPLSTQITMLTCEEGWSFIAEWTGVPLSYVLNLTGALPHAKYVVYFSLDPEWWDSVDMADAWHPQTILTYAMNGAQLPVEHGAPLRMRVPRQLGYKSVKHLSRLIVTDSLKGFGAGNGSADPKYSWYAGI